jgi:hypothetical protein
VEQKTIEGLKMAHTVFIFGELRSGKSTICASVIKYLLERKQLALRPNLGNRAGAVLMYDWLDRLRTSKYPAITESVLHVEIALEDLTSTEQFGLTFIEAPGEHLERLVPLHDGYSAHDKNLAAWLQGSHVIIVVLPSRSSQSSRNRAHQFLSLLLESNKTDAEMALVISKWDLLGIPNDRQSVDRFVAEHYPECLRLLVSRSFTSKAEAFGFSAVLAGDEATVCDGVTNSLQVERSDSTTGAKEIGEWLIRTRKARHQRATN